MTTTTTNQPNVNYDNNTEEYVRINQDKLMRNSPGYETNSQQKYFTKDETIQDYTIIDRYLAKIHSNMDSRYPPPGVQLLDSRKPTSLFPIKVTSPMRNADRNDELIPGSTTNIGFDYSKIYEKHDWNIPLTPSLQTTLTQNFCAYFYYRYCNSMGDTMMKNATKTYKFDKKREEKPPSSSQVERTCHQSRRRQKSQEHSLRDIPSPAMPLSSSSSSSPSSSLRSPSALSSASSSSSPSQSSLSTPSHLSSSIHQQSVRNRKSKQPKRKHQFQRSKLCPFFFIGSLSNAVKLSERPNGRPWPVVLLYLHHEESPYTQEFVTKILCSTNDDNLKQPRQDEEQELSFDHRHYYQKHHHHHQQRYPHQGKGDKQNLHRKEHFNIDSGENKEGEEDETEEKNPSELNDVIPDRLNDVNNGIILPQPSNSSLNITENNIKESSIDEATINLSNSTQKLIKSVKIQQNLNLSNTYTNDNVDIKTKPIDTIEHSSYCSINIGGTSSRNSPLKEEEEEVEEDVKIKTKQKPSLQPSGFCLKSIKNYWKSVVSKNTKHYNGDYDTGENYSAQIPGISHFDSNDENVNEKELNKTKLNAPDNKTDNSTVEVVKFSEPFEMTTITSELSQTQTPGTNMNSDIKTDDIYITNYKSKDLRGLLFERSAGLFPWDCTQIEARIYLMSAFPETRLVQWLNEWKDPNHYPTLIAIGRTAEGDVVCSHLQGSTASLDNALYWLNNVTLAHFNNYRQFTKPNCPEKREKFLLSSTSSPPPSSVSTSLPFQMNETCLLHSTIHLTIPPTNMNDVDEMPQCKVYNNKLKSSNHQSTELNHSPVLDERFNQIDGTRVIRNMNSRQLKPTIIQDDFSYRIIKSPNTDEEALSTLFELPQEVEAKQPSEKNKIIQKSFKSIIQKMNKPEKYEALLKTNRRMIIRPKLSKQLSHQSKFITNQKSYLSNTKYHMSKTNDPHVNNLQLAKRRESISKDGYNKRFRRVHRHDHNDDVDADADDVSPEGNNDADSCDNNDDDDDVVYYEDIDISVNVNTNENDQSSLLLLVDSVKPTNSQLDYLKSCIVKGSNSMQELFKLSDIFEYYNDGNENDQNIDHSDLYCHSNSTSTSCKELKSIDFLQGFNQQYVIDLPSNPSFLISRLSTAVIRSFDLNKFKQIRPLLIYLHDSQADGAIHFVSNILCSKRFTNKLYENNLLIWPLDVTCMTKSNSYHMKNITEQYDKQKRQLHSSLRKYSPHDPMTSTEMNPSKLEMGSRYQKTNKHSHPQQHQHQQQQQQQQQQQSHRRSDRYTSQDDDYFSLQSSTTSATEFYVGQLESSHNNEGNFCKQTSRQNNTRNYFSKYSLQNKGSSLNAQRLLNCFEKHPAGETFKQVVKISALPVLVNLKWHNEYFLVSHLLLPSSTTKESLNWIGSVLKLYMNEAY